MGRQRASFLTFVLAACAALCGLQACCHTSTPAVVAKQLCELPGGPEQIAVKRVPCKGGEAVCFDKQGGIALVRNMRARRIWIETVRRRCGGLAKGGTAVQSAPDGVSDKQEVEK